MAQDPKRLPERNGRTYFLSASSVFFFFFFFFSSFFVSSCAKEIETAPMMSDRPSIKVINFLMCLEFSYEILGRLIPSSDNDGSAT